MAAAAFQQAPITFHRSTPSVGRTSSRPQAFAFSSSSALTPKFNLALTNKSPLSTSRRGDRGSLTITMFGKASTSYAAALADIGKTSGTLEAIAADLEKIDQLFADPAIFRFFTSPVVTADEKRAVIDDIASHAQLQPDLSNFLNVLLDAERFAIIRDIVKEYDLAYNVLTGTQTALVTSVVPLESQQLAQLAKEVQKLTGAKNVRIRTAIDESLIAGFVITYGPTFSSMIDMSVKKQLAEIAAEIEVPSVQLPAPA